MPEVGVLNLTIHDNSKTAADGLNQLADALGRIQGALGNGLRLSGVSKPLNTFAKAVGDNSKSLANVGTFMNAVSSYAKAFDEAGKVKFNAQPIKDLKEAIGDGIKIGQAGTQITKIREALGGEWNVDNAYKAGMAMSAIGEGAKSIPSGLEKKANGVKALAEALNEYANVMERIKTVTGGSSFNGNEMFSATTVPVEQAKKDLVDYQQVVDRMKDIQEETKVSFREPLLKLNLQLHGRKNIPGDFGMDMDAMRRMTSSDSSDFVKIEETIHSATDAAGEFKIRLEEIGDTVTSIRYNPFEEMYQSFSKLSGELGWFKKEGMRLMAGPDIHRSVSNGNMLSTQVGQLFTKEIYDSWKPNFVMDDSWMNNMYQRMVDMYNEFGWFRNSSPALPAGQSMLGLPAGNAIEANVFTDAQGDIHAVVEETKEAIKATQQYIDLSSARALHERDAAKYAEKEWSFEDIYNGVREQSMGKRSLMSEWLHGQGTETEQMYAIKTMAQQFGMTIDEVKQKITELNGMTIAPQNGMQDLEKMLGMDKVDLMSMKYDAMKQSAAEAYQSGNLTTEQFAEQAMRIQQYGEKLEEARAAQDRAAESTWNLNDALRGLGTGVKGLFPGLTQLIKRFTQIAKYRLLRSVIRHITSGFTEGVQNVYQYSKAIGGSFAPAMDSAATALQQMKNSFGAALAPAIQALIPVLQTVVNWVVTAVNWLNQLFALLNGQKTWTRALPATTEAFNKQKKAAKGAGAAIKDLLADWDELNIIQSQTGGGGSGAATGAEEYLEMFEEVGKFDNKIKEIVGFLQENMDDILDIAKDIGIALLGWKFASAFTGVLGAFGKLVAAEKIIEVTWKLTEKFDKEYMKTGDNGWLIADAVTNMVGDFFAGEIIASVLGGEVGAITAGIAMTVSGGISYGISLTDPANDNAKMLQTLGLIKAAIGLAAMAAGFDVATGSGALGLGLSALFGIPLFTLTAAVTVVVEKTKSAKEIAREAFFKDHENGIDIDELFNALNDELKRQTAGYHIVVEAFANVPTLKVNLKEATEQIALLSQAVSGEGHLTQNEADQFKQAWQTVFEAITGITQDSFDTVFKALNESLTAENAEIRNQAKELRISMLMLQDNTTEGLARIKANMDELADKITSGSATEEEIKKYQDYVEALANMTNTSMNSFNELIESGATVNFKDEDTFTAFFGNVNEAAEKSLQEIDDGLKAGLGAIDEIRSVTEFRKAVGDIGETEYNEIMAKLDETVANITAGANDKKKKVQDSVQAAYDTVLKSALEGLKDLPITEYGTPSKWDAYAYMIDYVMPIVEAMDKAGLKIDEEVAKAFGVGESAWEYIKKNLSMLSTGEFPMLEFVKKYLGYTDEEIQEGIEKVKNAEKDFSEAYEQFKQYDQTPIESPANGLADALNLENYLPKDWSFSLDGITMPTVKADQYTDGLDGMVDATEEAVADIEDLYYELRDTINMSEDLNLWQKNDALDKIIELKMQGKIDELQTLIDYINQFGVVEGFKTYEQFGQGLGSLRNPARLSARGLTMSDVGWTPRVEPVAAASTNAEEKETIDYNQMTTSVSNGTRSGNENVVSELRSIMLGIQRLLAKEWTVNVTPSAGWGNHNTKSSEEYEKSWG